MILRLRSLFLPRPNLVLIMIRRNYSGYRGKAPNLRCLRVLRTRKHLKFGDLPIMAE